MHVPSVANGQVRAIDVLLRRCLRGHRGAHVYPLQIDLASMIRSFPGPVPVTFFGKARQARSLMFDWLKRKQQRKHAAAAGADPNAAIKAMLDAADASREAAATQRAFEQYDQALVLDAGNVYARFWKAQMFREAHDLVAAARECELGLAVEPNEIGLLLLRGEIAADALDPLLALEYFERIAQLEADVPEVDGFLADQYCFLGCVDEGVAAFDRALAHQPDLVRLQSNRLFVLNYSGQVGPEGLFEEHRAWGAKHEAAIAVDKRPHPGSRDPDRKLRVGYVSPDLRQHPVAFFVEALLRNHDRSAFDIVCFDTSPYPEDAFTARLKQEHQTWRRVGDLGDQALAEAIRSSTIDVLVDLSGHTSGHRLLAFARKPAPVQATWLGYLNTTGLTRMDYRITDAYLDPEGMTEHLHTETLFRLPHHTCFVPFEGSPDVTPLPSAGSRPPTFGSVNQWSKVTVEVKDVWARLLRTVPDARLVAIVRGGQNPALRDRVIADFVERGVRPEQIAISPFLPIREFLALVGSMDVTLDPFPYGGGTTTMQSLWMGVPVVALAGRTPFARNSVGPLTLAGLGHLVADSADRYVAVAADLVRDREALARIRGELRETMRASPLVDAQRFTRAMEAAYRVMWRSHVAGAPAAVTRSS